MRPKHSQASDLCFKKTKSKMKKTGNETKQNKLRFWTFASTYQCGWFDKFDGGSPTQSLYAMQFSERSQLVLPWNYVAWLTPVCLVQAFQKPNHYATKYNHCAITNIFSTSQFKYHANVFAVWAVVFEIILQADHTRESLRAWWKQLLQVNWKLKIFNYFHQNTRLKHVFWWK